MDLTNLPENRSARTGEELADPNHALATEVSRRKAAEEALDRERFFLRALIDNLPDAIYAKDIHGRKILTNPADIKNSGCTRADEVLGKTDAELYPVEIAERYRQDDETVLYRGQSILWREEYLFDKHGNKHWILTSKLPIRDADGSIIGLMGVGRDITPLKDAEQRLETVHRDLVRASREAGMAEVATNVLHNVGNVLNSVNISATLILEKLRNLKVGRIVELAKLLEENEKNLASFLQNDRDHRIIEFLQAIGGNLESERASLCAEATNLEQQIDHIKQIVAMQQNYSVRAGISEKLPVTEIVEDALTIHRGAYERHQVSVVREYQASPLIVVDRHKVLQILVNLLSNAKYACESSQRKDKQVIVRITLPRAEVVRIEIEDNGIGIAKENMTHIFSQGFSTRKGGHGFGLHSSALAAGELKGKLSVHSKGSGMGATFTLELLLGNLR